MTREMFSLDPQPSQADRCDASPSPFVVHWGLSHYERIKHVLDPDLSLIAKEYTPLCPYDTIYDQTSVYSPGTYVTAPWKPNRIRVLGLRMHITMPA